MTISRIVPVVTPISRPAQKATPAPDYIQQPEPEPTALRNLALAVIDRVEARSPWRPFVTRIVPGADVIDYPETGSATTTQAYTTLAGPSAQIVGTWVRTDHTGQTAPTDITWSLSANSLRPHEYFVLTTLTEEQLRDARQMIGIKDGRPVVTPYGKIDPEIVASLADAVIRDENTAFAQGAGSVTDPVTGLVGLSGITSTAATGTTGDIIAAIGAQRVLKWDPNAVFVSAAFETKLRNETDTEGNRVFRPSEPLVISDLPVVTLNGLPSGTTHCVIGDFTKVVVIHRLMPNGLLARVFVSQEFPANFTTFKRTYRVSERWDMGLVPGYTTAITKLTGVQA